MQQTVKHNRRRRGSIEEEELTRMMCRGERDHEKEESAVPERRVRLMFFIVRVVLEKEAREVRFR